MNTSVFIGEQHVGSCRDKQARHDITTEKAWRWKMLDGYRATKHPLYQTWASIKTRCYNTKRRAYRNYGGRGITMCQQWQDSFECFLRDVGPRPPGTTLDRYPNRDGNYEPGNVRWATPLQQAPTPHFVTYNGQTKQLAEWAREIGVPFYILQMRFKNGWTPEQALTTPVKPRTKGIPRITRYGALASVGMTHLAARLELNGGR